MTWLADESVDRPIILRLRQDGHAVNSIAEESPGIGDEDVLRRANERGALLLTIDSDFGELVFRLDRAPVGVVLFRCGGLTNLAKADLASEALRLRGDEMPGAFSVIAPGSIRIRKLTNP